MPSWNEMGSIFNTLRELDVSAIREEAERPVTIACVGDRALFDQLEALLRLPRGNRHGPAGADPLRFHALAAPGPDDELRRADLLLVLLDGRRPLPAAQTSQLGRVAALAAPTVMLIVGVSAAAELGPPRPEFAHAQIAVVPSLDDPASAAAVATAIFARLPGELHLAAARRMPGLRDCFAQELVNTVAFTNASFAVASSLPEQIPILSVPFVAADMLVLTKNQALMVYRLALAFGAPPEFKDRMLELGPVVGGGFLWRQLARSLIGLVPIWGVVPKIAIAYAGTFTTGVAAWRWFADGEILSRSRLRELTDEAMGKGRQIARALVDGARENADKARRGFAGVKFPALRFPGRKNRGSPSVEDKGQPPGV